MIVSNRKLDGVEEWKCTNLLEQEHLCDTNGQDKAGACNLGAEAREASKDANPRALADATHDLRSERSNASAQRNDRQTSNSRDSVIAAVRRICQHRQARNSDSRANHASHEPKTSESLQRSGKAHAQAASAHTHQSKQSDLPPSPPVSDKAPGHTRERTKEVCALQNTPQERHVHVHASCR
jgi:hypothetical protein